MARAVCCARATSIVSTRRTLRRSFELLSAFRFEQTEPDRFYDLIASDAVAVLGEHLSFAGALVIDVGGGAGYFTNAVRRAGATCFFVEPSVAELSVRGVLPTGGVMGDGYRMPFRDETADLVISSNVLEHVARPYEMIDELARIARPGGFIWVSFTNWYGPWGGHETAPWHYLGGELAMRRYVTKNSRLPKQRFGSTLFAVHVGPTLRFVRNHPLFEVVEAGPRYHPSFVRGIVRVPGIREVATWNLELLLRKRP